MLTRTMKVIDCGIVAFVLATFAIGCGHPKGENEKTQSPPKAVQSSPAGVYTFNRQAFRRIGRNKYSQGWTKIYYKLDLRSDNSALVSSEMDGDELPAMALGMVYTRGKGDIRAGKASWTIRDSKVLVTQNQFGSVTFTVEGEDLIHEDGVRYLRVR